MNLWRAANYDLKHEATRVYQRAILRGEVVRSDTCEDCGRKCKTHGHHEDYAKPFDLVWLCPLCHSWRHRYRSEAVA